MRHLIPIFLFMLSLLPQIALAQDCTSPNADHGVIVYNADYAVWQGCTPNGWIGLNAMVCPEGDFCNPPSSFSFTDQTGVAPSTPIQSNIVQITGLSGPATVSITGDGSPEFRICSASDCSTEVVTWGSADQQINNNQYLQLQLNSSGTDSTLHSATVTVNGTDDQWDVTTGASGPTNCDTIGQQCDDNSFYIGISPEDGTRVYMTDASFETSTRWDEDPPCYRCGLADTGATSITDGRANVEALRAYSGDNATAGNLDGFGAAKYCDGLNAIEAHGYDDWYLPAGGPNGSSSEINLIWEMVDAVGVVGGLTASSGGWYWSSSEYGSGSARVQRFGDGGQVNGNKANTLLVRCVRR